MQIELMATAVPVQTARIGHWVAHRSTRGLGIVLYDSNGRGLDQRAAQPVVGPRGAIRTDPTRPWNGRTCCTSPEASPAAR